VVGVVEIQFRSAFCISFMKPKIPSNLCASSFFENLIIKPVYPLFKKNF
jgi:hypothetical protein